MNTRERKRLCPARKKPPTTQLDVDGATKRSSFSLAKFVDGVVLVIVMGGPLYKVTIKAPLIEIMVPTNLA